MSPSRAVPGIPWSSDLNTLAQRFGERVAVDTGRAQMTYTQLNQQAHGLAALLLDKGVQPGDYVGIYLPNGIEAVWADFGVTLTGACLVHLNAAYTSEEIAWAAHLAPMRFIVTDSASVHALAQVPEAQCILTHQVAAATEISILPSIAPDVPGRIIYSSGTTGKPKALVYDQRRRWLAMIMLRAVLPFTPAPGSRTLLMTPYVHGASMQTRAWLDYGGTAVLLDGVHLDIVRTQLAGGRVDAIFAPPTVLTKLTAAFAGERLTCVRTIFTGTQTLTPSLYAKARAIFGPIIRVTYGKSENVNPITVLDASDTEACFAALDSAQAPSPDGACLGWPAPGVEIRIGDGDEIHLRSQHMYAGHIDERGFHDADADGWHRTGDLGRLDAQGRLWLLGRMADMIKTGGYKVYPEEIERVLAGTSGCGDICVISLPSEYWGEVIVAVGEDTGHGDAWVTDARKRLDELARYKHPRAYVIVTALPRNPQGKISRRAVRDMVLKSHDLEDGSYPQLTPRAG